MCRLTYTQQLVGSAWKHRELRLVLCETERAGAEAGVGGRIPLEDSSRGRHLSLPVTDAML